MNTPAVSIVVPIYNVSKYIERCAHSLLGQSFGDIEYVFVNDCTPDDSIEILQSVINLYPHRKERVKIIHHERNRGVGAARNTCIAHATGTYIQFIDADDWVEADMIEHMYTKAVSKNADIVVSDMFVEEKNATVYSKEHISYNNQTPFQLLLEQKYLSWALWNKLMKRELYTHSECTIPEGLNYSEDLHVCIRLFYFAQKIVKINRAFYHYNKTNEHSITYKNRPFHYENMKLVYTLLKDFVQKENLDEIYLHAVEHGMIQDKVQILIDSTNYTHLKQGSELFRNIEMKYLKDLKRGEKITLFLTHYQLFIPAHIFLIALRYKNRKK
ncbi:MAG: glycosyltransferase [Bacteroidales bacterium]|jgi:glycosyltransferase involved in cell wall biosynthesis|nr:glycosyltransferase [Bacteroidales bacterium]